MAKYEIFIKPSARKELQRLGAWRKSWFTWGMRYSPLMTHKTITLNVEAYDTLRGLRSQPKESLSQVVLRLAQGFTRSTSGSALVDKLFADTSDLWLPSESELDRLDEIQGQQRAPRCKTLGVL